MSDENEHRSSEPQILRHSTTGGPQVPVNLVTAVRKKLVENLAKLFQQLNEKYDEGQIREMVPMSRGPLIWLSS